MKKIKKLFFLIFVLMAGISLIFFNGRNNFDFLKNLNFKTVDAIKNPFLYIGNQITFLKFIFGGIENLKKENEILKEENIKLQSEIVDFEKTKKENYALRNALKIKDEKKLDLVFAKVVLKASQALGDYFIIDKGEEDGLEIGQAAIINEVVVGKIFETYSNYSKVLMLANPLSKLSAVVQVDDSFNLVGGLVEGFLNQSANIKFIEKSGKISLGNLVVSSGMDEKIPFGFLIGRIEHISEAENSVFIEALVKLPVSLEQINEVFIIKR